MRIGRQFIGFIVLALSGELTVASESATVYFVPFRVDTYVPITKQTIRSAAWEKWIVTDRSRVSTLMKLLRGGKPHEFYNADVRAVIYNGNEIFYVNKVGDVEAKDGSSRIDIRELSAFLSHMRDDERAVVHE